MGSRQLDEVKRAGIWSMELNRVDYTMSNRVLWCINIKVLSSTSLHSFPKHPYHIFLNLTLFSHRTCCGRGHKWHGFTVTLSHSTTLTLFINICFGMRVVVNKGIVLFVIWEIGNFFLNLRKFRSKFVSFFHLLPIILKLFSIFLF